MQEICNEYEPLNQSERFILQVLASANDTLCSLEFIADIEYIFEFELENHFPLLPDTIGLDDIIITEFASDVYTRTLNSSKELKQSIITMYPEALI
jgi:hypothetical protein